MSLMEVLGKEVSEFRSEQAQTYPVAGMLALIAMATFCDVMHGQRDLAAFGRTLSQVQMRALKFRCVPRSNQREAPGETTFMRVFAGADAAQVERALVLWQDQMLGVAQDSLPVDFGFSAVRGWSSGKKNERVACQGMPGGLRGVWADFF